jgi:predicted nucleotide-binding protein (sugar kinase/HSP70/actin superfamily)
MEIKKITQQIVETTDGKEIHIDDVVVFNTTGGCFVGTYQGISKKGALMFDGVIANSLVTFNVMPKSISAIYLADIKVETPQTSD